MVSLTSLLPPPSYDRCQEMSRGICPPTAEYPDPALGPGKREVSRRQCLGGCKVIEHSLLNGGGGLTLDWQGEHLLVSIENKEGSVS